ncbi:hypothetical protein Emtol_0923 [Emticicia oligotrophica DSM 17448]|uniref:DUF3500 domain-containing protein n=1 Tax=Emticicia oligotrophica (strain DSM 17448 / CIP 109782 / MTCC 6937 / GPTSA100-15) TaxID=929562 RepID=A0ABN4AIW2_EMTOG|nr:DUF3500 domain-containing protein [Emticicia oligotrophica]AFK02074.1 hypothetical protein Emtol_0923 [Emticicia oligotrophica DSM 17448]
MKFKNAILSLTISAAIMIAACEKTEVTTATTATVTALSCSSVTYSGTPSAGAAFTGTATVPYTGGNGAAYSAGTAIASTGVTGLTATLAAGTLASGAGSVTYAITGTPLTSGTASFAVLVGGQSCTLSLTVSATSSGTGTTTTTAGWSIETDINTIVAMANAFKATLSSTQVSALQDTYNKAHAQKWSNLPEALYRGRSGLQSSTFSTAQWTAFYNLLKSATSTTANEGNDEYIGILAADDYLNSIGGGSDYGSGNYYIAFIGTPSATGLWCLQIGGHHGTIIYTYNGGKMTGGTPSFRSTEPFPSYVWKNVTYQPIAQELNALSAMLKGLSATELTSAKRSSTQTDLILGPAQDNKFPTTKTGVKVGDLTQAKKDLVLAAIKTYTDDLDDKAAAAVYAKYKSEIDNTYISYSGTTDLTTKNDYVLIDGPNVWIEFSMQGGIIVRNANHPHSVWRDRAGDYGGN